MDTRLDTGVNYKREGGGTAIGETGLIQLVNKMMIFLCKLYCLRFSQSQIDDSPIPVFIDPSYFYESF